MVVGKVLTAAIMGTYAYVPQTWALRPRHEYGLDQIYSKWLMIWRRGTIDKAGSSRVGVGEVLAAVAPFCGPFEIMVVLGYA